MFLCREKRKQAIIRYTIHYKKIPTHTNEIQAQGIAT